MKQLRYIIFLTIAAGFIACNDKMEEQSPAPSENENQIEFEIDLGTESKVITDSEFKSKFEKGDEIGLFIVKRKKGTNVSLQESDNHFHNIKLVCLGGTKCASTQKVEYAAPGEVLDFYAYYPYNPEVTNPANIAFKVSSNQNEQTEDDKYNYSLSDLMVAKPITDVEKKANGLAYIVYLKFKHKMAMIHMDIPKLQMNGVDLKGVGPRETLEMYFPEVKTGGKFNLITQEFELSDEQSKIQMHRAERKDADKYFDLYSYRALLPPQEIAANRIVDFEQDGISYTFDTEDAVKLKEGMAKRYSITMPITSIHSNLIEAGTFMMGMPDDYTDEKSTYVMEKPQHYVQLTKNYRMSSYTITNAQYALFLNAWNEENPGSPIRENVHYNKDHDTKDASWFSISKVTSGFDERSETRIELVDDKWRAVPGYENFPMTFVSFDGAKAFAAWLGWELPSEAQWEYACRAGSTTLFSFGDDLNMLSQYGWCELNTEFELIDRQGARYIGTKAPNPWGLYDMHGNCREWVADKFDYPKDGHGNLSWVNSKSRYSEDTTQEAPSMDPINNQGEYQLSRGGGWYSSPQEAFSSKRTMENKNVRTSYHGIRLIHY